MNSPIDTTFAKWEPSRSVMTGTGLGGLSTGATVRGGRGPSIHVRFIVLLNLIAMVAMAGGCGSREGPTATSGERSDSDAMAATIQLNWYPEAEHGGVYQAVAEGLYASEGVDVTVRPGGRAIMVAPELGFGRCQFAVVNADDVVLYRREGADVVAVLAAVQNHPRCILVRDDSGVESFEDLRGMTLQRQPGRMFLEYLRSRGLLEGVREVAYNGVAGLVTDPKMAIQAYSFAEPYQLREQGVEPRVLMVSELGWNPYSSVLVTTGELIRDDPELVGRVVRATRDGWQRYLTDPQLGNDAILEANEYGMTEATLRFGTAELRPLALPGDAEIESVGQMTAERWQTLVRQIDELDPSGAGAVRPEDCYSTEFLPDP